MLQGRQKYGPAFDAKAALGALKGRCPASSAITDQASIGVNGIPPVPDLAARQRRSGCWGSIT